MSAGRTGRHGTARWDGSPASVHWGRDGGTAILYLLSRVYAHTRRPYNLPSRRPVEVPTPLNRGFAAVRLLDMPSVPCRPARPAPPACQASPSTIAARAEDHRPLGSSHRRPTREVPLHPALSPRVARQNLGCAQLYRSDCNAALAPKPTYTVPAPRSRPVSLLAANHQPFGTPRVI